MSTPARRRTDPSDLRPWLETYPRGQVLALMIAPQAAYAAGSPSLALAVLMLFVLVAVLVLGRRR